MYPNTRVRAAQAALNVEKPRLESVPPPLDLVPEPIEPIADVVARQRARADKMMLEDPAFLAVRNFRAISLKGNGADDGSDCSNDDAS
jgi:hypothetical protein